MNQVKDRMMVTRHRSILIRALMAVAVALALSSWCTGSGGVTGVICSKPTIGEYINQLEGRIVLAEAADGVSANAGLESDLSESGPAAHPGKKSPLRAFIYSFIIPGTGQIYNGSKWKAAAFLGLEAVSWTGYFHYDKIGDNKTDDFHDYADTYWLPVRYENWLEKHWDVRDDELVINELGFPLFTHHLPDTKTQQYYEMIGKYNQFVYGWVDTDTASSTGDPHPTAPSALRDRYESMRHEANQMYDRATTSLIVMMVNHLISGFEAALAARRHNNNLPAFGAGLSITAVVAGTKQNSFPMLSVRYNFE